MEAGASSGQEVLQLRAVLRSISPLIWRRLLVRGDTSVARLHQILQIAFGWQDMHLHRFEIRGREYGVHQEGGVFFDTEAHEVLIGHASPGGQARHTPGGLREESVRRHRRSDEHLARQGLPSS